MITTKPRLPIDRKDRLKFPLRPAEIEQEEDQNLLLAGKEGEELERLVKRLYKQKIKK